MSETRTRILSEATSLTRQRGYASFSFAHLAETVGIRKPSIHHHFPNKADLGVNIVLAYSKDMREKLENITEAERTPIRTLRAYSGLYSEGLQRGELCLCAMLATEADAVPEVVQVEVQRFFRDQLSWIATQVSSGQLIGEIRSTIIPEDFALDYLSSLQGAAVMARSLGIPEKFDRVVEDSLATLSA